MGGVVIFGNAVACLIKNVVYAICIQLNYDVVFGNKRCACELFHLLVHSEHYRYHHFKIGIESLSKMNIATLRIIWNDICIVIYIQFFSPNFEPSPLGRDYNFEVVVKQISKLSFVTSTFLPSQPVSRFDDSC